MMSMDADLQAWLRLSLLDGLGPQSLRKLLIAHEIGRAHV